MYAYEHNPIAKSATFWLKGWADRTLFIMFQAEFLYIYFWVVPISAVMILSAVSS